MIVNKPTIKKKKKISRYTVLCIVMSIIFTIITFRLLYLQVFSYEEYKERADVSSTRFVADKAPRGKIYDQKGTILATNRQTYTITYTKTEEADKQLYSTMKQLFKILDENGEKVQDTLPLKIDSNNKIYFQYASNKKESQDIEELRFKKDRGLNDVLKKKDEKLKNVEQLSEEQNSELDKALLKMTTDDSFYELVKAYNLVELIDPDYKTKEKSKIYSLMSGKELTNLILEQGYSLNDIRKFMLIKDAIKMQSFKGYRSVTIAGNIQRNTSLIIRQKKYDLPGIDVSLTPIREYPFNNLASSVLGYVSSITDNQKEKYELKGYDISSDLIGTDGIESAFEEQLKGVKGGTTIKVNSQGTKTQDLFKLESYPGNDVHLTLDSGIQYAAEQSFADGIKNIVNTPDPTTGYRYLSATRGALIATEVKTGRILSLVSYPDFNPNLFAVPGQLTQDESRQYINPDLTTFGQEFIQRMGLNKTIDDLFPLSSDKKSRLDQYEIYPRPMYNYATMAKIPPGSTFKPLTALAGLESGAIDPSTVIYDKGKFNEHPEVFGTAFAPGGLEAASGPTTLTRAISESINYYFYETAYRMYMKDGGNNGNIKALDSIAKYAWQFGLGVDPNSKDKASTGIEIGENFGKVYSFEAWKENIIDLARLNIVEALEKGEYNGRSFISFDIRSLDDDNDEVKKSKKAIKDKVYAELKKYKVESMMNHDEFAKFVKSDIRNIMEHSDIYKSRVAEYESSGRKVNLDSQASAVAEAIAQFTINDQPGQMRTPGQLVNASIGQGMNNFTPLQLVSYISTLANGGTRYKLHLVDKITDNDGKVVQEFKPEVLNTVSFSKSTQEAIKNGMTEVNKEGTAKTAFLGFPSQIQTAGKTGTADTTDDQREKGRSPYATYIGYAPADDPEIAVFAVVFDGGHGSSIASAARAVYEAYFKDRILQLDPNYASKSTSFQKYVVDCPIGKK
jgi:penicillin-binding protein 2